MPRARPRPGGAFQLSNSKSQLMAFGKIGRLGCLPVHGATWAPSPRTLMAWKRGQPTAGWTHPVTRAGGRQPRRRIGPRTRPHLVQRRGARPRAHPVGAEEAGPKGNAGSPGVLCGRPSSLTRAADRAPAAWKHLLPPKVGLGLGWPHEAPTGTQTILGHTRRASLVLRHGPGQRGDRLSSHPHRPGSPTRMGLVLGTPAAATNTARAGPWDTTPIPRWTASYHMGRYPRYRVPSVRPVGLSQPAPHGIKNLEAKTPPATGKIHLQVTV